MSEFFANYLAPTKTIYSMWVIMAVIVIVSIVMTRGLKIVPGKLQNVAEMAVGYIVAFMRAFSERRRQGNISPCSLHSSYLL